MIPVKEMVFILFVCLSASYTAVSQGLTDTAFSMRQVPEKYLTRINGKIAKYQNRIASKTEKTLIKLSRWENKIHTLLEKADPRAAARLFGNNQATFTSLLQKVKEGKSVVENYTAPYDGYIDNLSTSIKYLQQEEAGADSKLAAPLRQAGRQMQSLQQNLDEAAYIQQFIKERKKQLFREAITHLGRSRYFARINKESYYYTGTLKNYKELFSDETRAEATVKEVLSKIPAFQQFMQKNSQLASLFRLPGNGIGGNTAQSLAGLQTRASVQAMIQQRIVAGGPNAMAQVKQNLAIAYAEMDKLKDRMNQLGGGSSDIEMPDFKPNAQKTKTLWQRLEYSADVQFMRANNLLPSMANIGLGIGYKLDDKITVGIGTEYKMGMGSLQHISITHQGLGLRSFMDWKIKKQFYVSGGYEMNYNSAFKNIEQLKDYSAWQRSALVGMSRKYRISKKVKGEMKLLYDFLARDHVPVSQPVVFRVGYKL